MKITLEIHKQYIMIVTNTYCVSKYIALVSLRLSPMLFCLIFCQSCIQKLVSKCAIKVENPLTAYHYILLGYLRGYLQFYFISFSVNPASKNIPTYCVSKYIAWVSLRLSPMFFVRFSVSHASKNQCAIKVENPLTEYNYILLGYL